MGDICKKQKPGSTTGRFAARTRSATSRKRCTRKVRERIRQLGGVHHAKHDPNSGTREPNCFLYVRLLDADKHSGPFGGDGRNPSHHKRDPRPRHVHKGTWANDSIFQVMTVAAEGKKDIYIRTDPKGSPHTITHQGIKIEGRGKYGGKGWYSGGSSDSGKGQWATSSQSGSRDQWTMNKEHEKGWSRGKWD